MHDNLGGIALFRPERNATRLQHSLSALNMPFVPANMFCERVMPPSLSTPSTVPPHRTVWSMYCRPLLNISGSIFQPDISEGCTFCVYFFLAPTGAAQEQLRAVKALILHDFDRAAPKGIGHVKAGGNCAGMLRRSGQAKKEGLGITLHFDYETKVRLNCLDAGVRSAVKDTFNIT